MNALTELARTLLPVFVLSQIMSGQTADSAQLSPQPGKSIAVAIRVDHPPRLDGTLHDPLWRQAPAITDFKQREPYEGRPSTERTEVRMLYSRNEIYFGIACH